MTKMAVVACVLTLVSTCVQIDLVACGDKFLLPSRGTRFERAPMPREPAAILLYANSDSELSRRLTDLSVLSALRRVGYRPTLVTTPGEFSAAIVQGRWDLVLVDLADARTTSQTSRDASSPLVLPVVYRASSIELAQARRQYSSVLKAPSRSQTFVEAIDAALDAWRATQAKATKKRR
jgi:ABC-type amino acid transport substrate-binding protein